MNSFFQDTAQYVCIVALKLQEEVFRENSKRNFSLGTTGEIYRWKFLEDSYLEIMKESHEEIFGGIFWGNSCRNFVEGSPGGTFQRELLYESPEGSPEGFPNGKSWIFFSMEEFFFLEKSPEETTEGIPIGIFWISSVGTSEKKKSQMESQTERLVESPEKTVWGIHREHSWRIPRWTS